MKNKYFFLLLSLLLAAALALNFTSCDWDSPAKKNYEPTYSPDSANKKILLCGVPTPRYYEILEPSVRYLNSRLKGVKIQLAAGSNFDDFLNKLDKKYYDFAMMSGLKAMECEMNGYTIVGKHADDEKYKGVIFVNKDSALSNVRDLIGKTIASPGNQALAGHMMPIFFLHKNGINIQNDINILYLGSFESAILNVYLGKCSAGFAWITSWNSFIKSRPEIASKVELKWQTPAQINNAILFRNDMPDKTADELKTLLFTLQYTEEGRKALEPFEVSKFEPANTDTYKPLKAFFKEYKMAVQ